MADKLKRFIQEFISSLWATVLATFAICASVAGIWPLYVSSEQEFNQKYFLALIMAVIVIIGAMAELARRQFRLAAIAYMKRDEYQVSMKSAEDKLLQANKDTKVTNAIQIGDQTLILVSPSSAFGTDTAVVVYQRDRDFEIEIGVGRANRFQGAGDRVQVVIVDNRGREDLWARICTGEQALLSSLVVRNALPFDVYQRLAHHG